MDTQASDAKSVREQTGSVLLVIWMAVVTSALRIAIWAANGITLWYLYGRATVARDHLRIVKIKPQLVVSNGDVLRGIGGYHYFVGVAIWLPLAMGLLLLIYHGLLPERLRELWQGDGPRQPTFSAIALLWALALFFLVTGLLPMGAAMAASILSVMIALIWARKIPYADGELR